MSKDDKRTERQVASKSTADTKTASQQAEKKRGETMTSTGTKAPQKGTASKSTSKPTSKKPVPEKSQPKRDVASASAAPPAAAPRRVRLLVSRLDPWSVMKLSFLLSVALGIAMVVAVALIWIVLNGMEVFGKINVLVTELDANQASGSSDLIDMISFGRVVSFATIMAVVNVVLLTAIATLGAVIYNMAAALVGGYVVTLTDD